MKKITSLDVMKYFYIGHELLKNEMYDPEAYHTRVKKYSQKQFKNKLKKVIGKSKKITKKDLMTFDYGWQYRVGHYLNFKWEYKEIELSRCGVWPCMGGLKEEYTTGNLIDTKDMIKKILDNKEHISFNDRRALYIEELTYNVEELVDKLPIIVYKDHIIRENKYSFWDPKKYKKCTYDIDDGNHRALAYALLGKKKIKAYVGTPKIKSELTN